MTMYACSFTPLYEEPIKKFAAERLSAVEFFVLDL